MRTVLAALAAAALSLSAHAADIRPPKPGDPWREAVVEALVAEGLDRARAVAELAHHERRAVEYGGTAQFPLASNIPGTDAAMTLESTPARHRLLRYGEVVAETPAPR